MASPSSFDQKMSQKSGKGRQKVKMAKMENKSNLQVTFSKRRYGLFKKASELCTLTGEEIGIIVYSPGRKVFSFGHPSVHKVVDKCFPTEAKGFDVNAGLLGGGLVAPDKPLVEAQKSASVAELNMNLSMLEMQLEAEKGRAAKIDERERVQNGGRRQRVPIDQMGEEELMELCGELHALRERITIIGRLHGKGFGPVGDMGNLGLFNPMNVLGYGLGFQI